MHHNNDILTKTFFLKWMAKFQQANNTKFDDLTRIINTSFEGMEFCMAKKEDLLALESRLNGKEIDSRAQVIDLQIRVNKIEQKIKLNNQQ